MTKKTCKYRECLNIFVPNRNYYYYCSNKCREIENKLLAKKYQRTHQEKLKREREVIKRKQKIIIYKPSARERSIKINPFYLTRHSTLSTPESNK